MRCIGRLAPFQPAVSHGFHAKGRFPASAWNTLCSRSAIRFHSQHFWRLAQAARTISTKSSDGHVERNVSLQEFVLLECPDYPNPSNRIGNQNTHVSPYPVIAVWLPAIAHCASCSSRSRRQHRASVRFPNSQCRTRVSQVDGLDSYMFQMLPQVAQNLELHRPALPERTKGLGQSSTAETDSLARPSVIAQYPNRFWTCHAS
jgi:hypothetical protein